MKHNQIERAEMIDVPDLTHDTSSQVDKAWRRFWQRRGFITPPPVSRQTIGIFSLPNGNFEEAPDSFNYGH